MRTGFIGVVTCAAAILVTGATSTNADTGAPTAQTFTLQCGGQTVTVVSPTERALAAQVVGSTGVGVLLRVTFDGSVLFQSPAAAHLPGGLTTTCAFGPLTLTVLFTP